MSKMASKDTDDRVMSVDELMKSLTLLGDNEKIKALTKKYEELHKLYRNTEYGSNTTRREMSSLIADNNKLILARSKLESLCRELQKQNKVIKDETILRIREEEEKRKQITQEFQKTLTNVTTMMSESNTQNTKLGEENKQMALRLSSIYEEFKSRESEVDRITKQMDLEKQLCEARCAKIKTEFMMERQALLVENDTLNQKIANLTHDLVNTSKSCTMLEQQVSSLTSQLEVYTGKYQEFETTISKSGRIFDHCKSEIDKLNKQIKVLEKEVTDWQNRYKKNINTIYELQLDNTEKTKIIDTITKKQNQLTKLCRQLQAERKAYINSLRDFGHDPCGITIDIADEDLAIEEPQPSTSNQPSNDGKSAGRGKNAAPKGKRGKGKGKKGKDTPPDFLTPPLTLKEIQLAELKQELDRVQKHVMQIHTLEVQCNTASETVKGKASSHIEQKTSKKRKTSTDDKTEDAGNRAKAATPTEAVVEKAPEDVKVSQINPQQVETGEPVKTSDDKDEDFAQELQIVPQQQTPNKLED